MANMDVRTWRDFEVLSRSPTSTVLESEDALNSFE